MHYTALLYVMVIAMECQALTLYFQCCVDSCLIIVSSSMVPTILFNTAFLSHSDAKGITSLDSFFFFSPHRNASLFEVGVQYCRLHRKSSQQPILSQSLVPFPYFHFTLALPCPPFSLLCLQALPHHRCEGTYKEKRVHTDPIFFLVVELSPFHTEFSLDQNILISFKRLNHHHLYQTSPYQ